MSQHPADLKPRGVKPALGLVPWSVYPEYAPAAVRSAAESARYWPDRDYGQDPRPFLRALLLAIGASRTEIAAAFAWGAARYAPWNWQEFAWDRAAVTEYFGAICRHLLALEDVEEVADDSGVSHRGHAAAGVLIWLWHENRARGVGAQLRFPGVP
jgi:hypothetical protein